MQIHTTCVFSSCTTQTMAHGTSANAHTLLGDCAHQAIPLPKCSVPDARKLKKTKCRMGQRVHFSVAYSAWVDRPAPRL